MSISLLLGIAKLFRIVAKNTWCKITIALFKYISHSRVLRGPRISLSDFGLFLPEKNSKPHTGKEDERKKYIYTREIRRRGLGERVENYDAAFNPISSEERKGNLIKTAIIVDALGFFSLLFIRFGKL